MRWKAEKRAQQTVDDAYYVRAQKELNSELREEEAEAVRETFDKR